MLYKFFLQFFKKVFCYSFFQFLGAYLRFFATP